MKSTFTFSLSLLLAGALSLPVSGADRKPARTMDLPGASLVRMDKHSTLPSFIRFENGKEIAFGNWQQWMSENLLKDSKNGFVLLHTDRDKMGDVHYRYQQSFNGHPYEHAIWLVHTRAGQVYAMNGLLYGQAKTLATTAALTEGNALSKALTAVGAEKYKWEIPAEEAHLKMESHKQEATYYPNGKLVYLSEGKERLQNNMRLCWKFNVYAHKPVSRSEIFVDATTGAIIHRNELLHEADVVGTAVTAYSGTQSITTDNFAGGFRLRETGRGDGINTYNMETGMSYGAAVDFTDADNNWNNVNPEMDEVATDAHWGAEKTYDYYMINHGRNSIDGAGFELNSYVHFDVAYANAFWDGDRMTYGDGDGAMGPLTALDIAGHEITHGLTTFTANLIYEDESGALNESFSDIFGVAIEWYANPSGADWLMGEDIGVVIRSMSNPAAFGDPDTYFGTNWAPLGGGDNGGVHTNSGVQNFWYYLLVNGGTGTNDNGDAYTVSGLGLDDASAIAFRNLTVYLTPSSDYNDARFYAIQSAIDLFGPCSPEVEATTNAWYAVGVGPAYVAAVISDFSAPVTLSCSAPFMVNFTNESNNASTFIWNFGDGFTSTANNPTHTYNTIGTYTVQLIADGGACGKDTLLLPNYITIDTSIACEINMPASGTGATQTACSGVLYDSGGPTNQYGASEDAQITIAPLGALTVDLDFTLFDVEDGPGTSCNYDNLTVYDGPNTSSPVIGVYCNNNIPTTLSSTGSSVTLKFHSDGGLELDGYIVNWSCNLSSVAPAAAFSADVTTTCNGTVNFTDLTANGPASWSWDFGDGITSTVQNPTHTYTANGVYTVTLVATNGIGSDTEVETAYITVNLPAAPTGVTGPGVTICSNTNTTLTATGAGTLTWYNVPTGGVALGTGSPFTTPLLTTSTTFYVANEIPSASAYVGPVDNTFGGGGNFAGDQHLVFTCSTPVILKSVQVYASGGGNRTIELRNSSGVVIQSATINVPNGSSRINLNFNIPVGTGLQLGTLDGSAPNLYRNNAGAAYPYTLPGTISITGSSAGTPGYYYFFYDWEIQEPGCSSARVPVGVSVQPCTGIAEVQSALGVQVVPNPANEQASIVVTGAEGKNAALDIRNSIGQLVWSEKKTLDNSAVVVNVGRFGRGVYFVNIVVDGQRIVKKLIVE